MLLMFPFPQHDEIRSKYLLTHYLLPTTYYLLPITYYLLMRLPSGKDVYSSTPMYPGSNFTWGEATDNCNRTIRDLVIDGRLIISAIAIEQNIVQTAINMDKYRYQLGGRPIIVNSWYRPSNVNSSVGGSKWSRHQYGDAVDWVCSHLTPAQIATRLEPYHNDGGYKCYIRENFTHTDWRGERARW